ncbi:MAG: DeoR/GlpR transcriptional regulator [Planctomycetales bacterium]|nr:DeoR/GlpR transcriptional regulator [Planctomycetales bacterium]
MPEESTSPPALPRERRQQELELLEQVGSVRVTQLARQFEVAEETIRRDLDLMGSQGLLIRTHGGAMRVRSDTLDQPNAVRRTTLVPEKQAIARAAAGLIQEGDALVLDASTTALELARLIRVENLTVVTNAIDTARVLSEQKGIKVLLTGGELDEEAVELIGPMADEGVRRFAFTKAFISCKAVDPERGVSEATLLHASVKRWMIDCAKQAYLLADHSKFGVRSTCFFCDLSDIDLLITDTKTDADLLDSLHEAGHKSLVAK